MDNLPLLPEDYVREFWNRTKALLKVKEKTQIDLCEAINVSLNTMRCQISRNSQPTIQEIIKISEYLDVSIEFLMTGKEREESKPKFSTEQLRNALQVCLDMIKD